MSELAAMTVRLNFRTFGEPARRVKVNFLCRGVGSCTCGLPASDAKRPFDKWHDLLRPNQIANVRYGHAAATYTLLLP